MNDKIITNVYVNKTSKTIRFYLDTAQIIQKLQDKAEEFKNALAPDELAGLIDGNIMNSKYTLLFDRSNISAYDAESAISAIKDEIGSYQTRRKRTRKEVGKETSILSTSSSNKVDNWVKVSVIFDVKFQKLSKTEVATKYWLNLLTVYEILNEFRLLKMNPAGTEWKVGRPPLLKEGQLAWLERKIKGSLLGKYFTLQSIKELTLDKFPELGNISTATLSRVMRNELGLWYKKATMLN